MNGKKVCFQCHGKGTITGVITCKTCGGMSLIGGKPCPGCEGTCYNYGDEPCNECGGSGVIDDEGEDDRKSYSGW